MSRLMVKLCVAFTICLATAAVSFAQRQPGSAGSTGRTGSTGSTGSTGTDRNRGGSGGGTGSSAGSGAGASQAADRGEAGQGRKARATFEVYKDKSGEYRWRLRATNTQIIAIASQGYSDKRSCMNAVESVKRDVVDAPIEEKEIPLKSDSGKAGGAEAGGGGTGAGSSGTKPGK